MKQESILITGNMGYVGPAVIRRLRKAYPNAKLIGLDSGFFAHCLTNADQIPERRLSSQLFVDLRNVTLEMLQGVDAVVHLAAISNDPMGSAYESATVAINVEAGLKLAKLAKQAKVKRFVFASSCSVYGSAETKPRTETDPVQPLTAYAKSKISTELALQALADDAFVVTCLRFPTACGMSDRLRLDLVLNDFVASAIATGKIEILSDGTPLRPLIDTQDMASAIHWAIKRDAQSGNHLVINVGRNSCNYQIGDVAEAVAKQIPNTTICINKNASPDKRSYRVNFDLYADLAQDHLPTFTLQDSIAELADGFKRMSFRDSDFRNSQYMRLRILDTHKAENRLSDLLEWIG